MRLLRSTLLSVHSLDSGFCRHLRCSTIGSRRHSQASSTHQSSSHRCGQVASHCCGIGGGGALNGNVYGLQRFHVVPPGSDKNTWKFGPSFAHAMDMTTADYVLFLEKDFMVDPQVQCHYRVSSMPMLCPLCWGVAGHHGVSARRAAQRPGVLGAGRYVVPPTFPQGHRRFRCQGLLREARVRLCVCVWL